MRLTYVIPYFAPAWAYGGPPRLAYDLARYLVRADHAVQVLTTDALDETSRVSPRGAVTDGVFVQRLPNISNWLAWNYKIFVPSGFRRALETNLSNGTDVVHLFDFRDYQNALALGVMRRRRVPYVLSALGELPRASGPKRPIKYIFDVLFGFRLLRHAAALVAQTPDEAEWYLRLGAAANRIHVLPLAVDLDAVPELTAPGAFRLAHGIEGSERIVLFLGRIHAYKGLDVLLRAFAQLRGKGINVRLVIAGRDDGYLADARRLAAELTPSNSVLFTGPIYGDERFAAYRDADLFAITPSHAEQTSLAALEAAACGTPVLTTVNATIPGLDAAGGGVTVECDVAAVREGLIRMLDGDRAAAGASAASLVRDRYSLAGVSKQLVNIYRGAIAARC